MFIDARSHFIIIMLLGQISLDNFSVGYCSKANTAIFIAVSSVWSYNAARTGSLVKDFLPMLVHLQDLNKGKTIG